MSILQRPTAVIRTEPSALVDRLRRPEYTGDNRCLPCTIVNVVLAVVASAGIGYGGVWLGGATPVAAGVAGASLVVFGAAIYLRGYLVPYTPTLTKRYLPDRVLRWFEHGPGQARGEEPPEAVDIERYLLEHDLLTECGGRDDWCLEPSFRRRWRTAMADLEDGAARDAAIADLLDVDIDRLDTRDFGSATLVKVDGRQVGQWESGAAFLADVAADAVLRDDEDSWNGLQLITRSRILNSLRMFLEDCPSCGAPVQLGQETVESCCRSFEVVAVTCTECDARLFELEADHLVA